MRYQVISYQGQWYIINQFDRVIETFSSYQAATDYMRRLRIKSKIT